VDEAGRVHTLLDQSTLTSAIRSRTVLRYATTQDSGTSDNFKVYGLKGAKVDFVFEGEMDTQTWDCSIKHFQTFQQDTDSRLPYYYLYVLQKVTLTVCRRLHSHLTMRGAVSWLVAGDQGPWRNDWRRFGFMYFMISLEPF